MVTSITVSFYNVLGNWWAFSILFVLSGIMFGYLVPRAQKAIFADVKTDLPPKVLDVHDMTWTPVEAGVCLRTWTPGAQSLSEVLSLSGFLVSDAHHKSV